MVNATEKPPHVWDRIIQAYCPYGGSVLDLCAGAGGDIRACIARGHDVVAVEQDQKQFDYLCGMLRSWDMAKGLDDDAEEKKANWWRRECWQGWL